MRLQPTKSTMHFRIQAQAARQQPKQPRMNLPPAAQAGWCKMILNLINYFSLGAQLCATGHHRAPDPEPPPCLALKLRLPPAQDCQIANLSTLSSPVKLKWHRSLPSSGPSELKGSKIEPKVIAIQTKTYPSRATSNMELQGPTPRRLES